MRVPKPSPAMVVAVAALVMATTGSAVAAIDFARNAGAVDHISAVRATSSVGHAAGKLVATARSGSHRGRIPGKFLADVPFGSAFETLLQVPDNANGAPATLNGTGLGSLTASCNDQNQKAGVEDPTTTISFAAGSSALNLASEVGGGAPTVVALAPGTVHTLTINGSNTFRLQVETGRKAVSYEGQVRQDGRGTANGLCAIAGTLFKFSP